MNKNLLYVGKGKMNARPIFCFSASCSNLVSMGSGKLSTERPAYTALFFLKVHMKMSAAMVFRSPTIELHGDLAMFLVVHDGIGAIVGLHNHYVSVQLCTRSCSVQQRRNCTKPWESKGREKHRGLPFSTSLPGVGERS